MTDGRVIGTGHVPTIRNEPESHTDARVCVIPARSGMLGTIWV
jgi:hypothetical protein